MQRRLGFLPGLLSLRTLRYSCLVQSSRLATPFCSCADAQLMFRWMSSSAWLDLKPVCYEFGHGSRQEFGRMVP